MWNQAHLRQVLQQYETHFNQHRPHRSLHAAAPLKPLPEPVDLDQYRVRRRTRVGALINEYRLVALPVRGFRHAQVAFRRQSVRAPQRGERFAAWQQLLARRIDLVSFA